MTSPASASSWYARREAEADAAGVSASLARQALVRALEEKDASLVRASAMAYGVLVDRAQELSTGAPAASVSLLDELAARRDAAGVG